MGDFFFRLLCVNAAVVDGNLLNCQGTATRCFELAHDDLNTTGVDEERSLQSDVEFWVIRSGSDVTMEILKSYREASLELLNLLTDH